MQRMIPRPRRFDFDVITDPIEPRPAPRPPQDGGLAPAAVGPAPEVPGDASKPAE